MQRTPLAALIAGLFTLPVQAAEIPSLDEIVVSATRFAQSGVREPQAVTVIDRNIIEHSGATNLPELLQQVAGLHVSPLYGAYSVSTSLDARGFGETGNSHVAVLLDGRRLNSVDSNGINNWHAIALNQVERIEVLRGSGTVLYGDNAMTAVINIISRPADHPERSASVRLGSFGTLEGDAALAGKDNGLAWRLAANAAQSANYRQHNQTELGNFSGQLEADLGSEKGLLAFGVSRLDSQLPGALTDAQYNADPRQANPAEASGGSFFDRRGAFLRPGLRLRLNPAWEFSAELGLEEEKAESWIATWSSYNDSRTRTWSLTPRLRYQNGAVRATFGLDWYDNDYRSLRGAALGTPNERINLDRQSLGLYGQAGWDATPDLTLSLGGRWQQVDQAITRAASQLANDRSKSAWDVGFSQNLGAGLRGFGKAGYTFRFPKVDDLTTFTGLGIDLKPEHGRHTDLGIEWKQAGRRVQATLYDLRLKDEIAWSNTAFQNENLDATRHTGLELDARLPLGGPWTLAAAYAWTEARFIAGANSGKDIPLVPRHQGRLAVEWQQTDTRASLSVNAMGSRRYGGDYDNSISRQSGHATADLALEKTWGAWLARFSAKNLFDRRYAAVGYEDGWTAPHALYPGDGRSLFITLAWKG
ncbi:MAG: TonB-dependent receptor [Gallionellaceae bacterium]|nr:TonB-dependent receptor [Gallionellaceae bacterium]